MAEAQCAYCNHHRWCLTCKQPVDVEGDACAACGEAQLGPPPAADGFHEPCGKVVAVTRAHQLLLKQIGDHAASAYSAALERVLRTGHVGWLDARVTSDVGGKAIQSRVQFMLRGVNEPARRGWFALWVSPDLVRLMRPEPAAQPEPAPAESSA